MVRLTDRLDMTIVVDWDVKPTLSFGITSQCDVTFDIEGHSDLYFTVQ